MTIQRTGSRATIAMAASAVLASGLVACSGDSADDLPEAVPPRTEAQGTPTPELTSEEQAAVDEAREVFDLFMTAYIEVATSGETPDLDVHFQYGQYAGSQAAIDVGDAVLDNFLEDRVAEGTIEWEFVEVVNVDLDRMAGDRESPEVRLRYCHDATAWVTVDKDTGEPATGAGGQHLSTITVGWLDDWGDTSEHEWRVTDWEDEEGLPC